MPACYTCLHRSSTGRRRGPLTAQEADTMIARFSRTTLALLIALVAVGMSFGSVSAAPAKPAPPSSANAALSRPYKLEQERLKVQDMRLKNADKYAGKIDELIAKLKAKGQDTTALDQGCVRRT